MKSIVVLCYLFFVAAAPSSSAQDKDRSLAELHSMLAPLQLRNPYYVYQLSSAYDIGAGKTYRGESPLLMDVKHRLRQWIELHLSQLNEHSDLELVTADLNAALRQADVFCEQARDATLDRCSGEPRNADFNAVGFIHPVDLERSPDDHFLVVKTSVGIWCGWDESAYAYEWRDGQWQRFWELEEQIQSRKAYRPQYIDSVDFSASDEKTRDRLVLALGHSGGCYSNWSSIHYRLWHANADRAQPRLLLSKSEMAFRNREPPIVGRVNEEGALIEFTKGSVDTDVHSFEAVRHFKINGGKVERIAPIALSPRTFTEEWLTSTWDESSEWSAPEHLTSLESWHRNLQADYIGGSYLSGSHHCVNAASVWEVGISLDTGGDTYFQVRWQPPYEFQMVAIHSVPAADCAEVDEEADHEHTLFPE